MKIKKKEVSQVVAKETKFALTLAAVIYLSDIALRSKTLLIKSEHRDLDECVKN